MHIRLLLASALLLAASVAAQPGPAPGYEDPLAYAADYAVDQAGNASTDPVGYAQAHASQDAVVNETAHAAYIACWTLDEYAAQDPELCDDFYTAPGEVGPLPADDPTVDAAEETADEITNATDALVGEVTGGVDDVLEDPSSAPQVLQDIAAAVVTFAETVVGAVLIAVGAIGQTVVALVEDIVGGIDVGLSAAAGGIGDAAGAVWHGLAAAVAAVGDGVSAAAAAVVSVAGSLAGAIGDGASATVSGLSDAATGAGDAIGSAASSLGDAVSDAVTDAWHAVKDTVSGWFSGGTQATPDRPGGLDTDRVTGPVDGLVDRVTGLLG